jgi:predicted transcriptional regulator
LKEKNQTEVFSLIRDQAYKLGLEIAATVPGVVKATLDAQPALVVDWVRGYLQSSGWGLFSFGKDDGVYALKVADPPISDNGGQQFGTQTYLCGLLLGLVEGVTGSKMDILNVYYNSQDRMLTLFAGELGGSEPRQIESTSPVITMNQKIGEHPKVLDSDKFAAIPIEPLNIRGDATNTKRLEIVTKILTAARNPTQKVRIMHSARINFAEANKMIEDLVNTKLLGAKEPDQFGVVSYQTTEKGVQALNEWTASQTAV